MEMQNICTGAGLGDSDAVEGLSVGMQWNGRSWHDPETAVWSKVRKLQNLGLPEKTLSIITIPICIT